MTLGVRRTKLLGVAAVAVIAIGATGCSSLPSVPDWVDPTTWFGDDNASAADNAQTPDLASIPDKPAVSASDDQRQVADSLAADRKNAKYSADMLRGGTEAAAAPPLDAPATPQVAEEEQVKAPKQSAASVPTHPVRVASIDRSVAQEPTGSAMAGTLPATAPGSAVASLPPPAEAVQTASLPEPPPAPPSIRPAQQTYASAAAPAAPAPDMSSPPPGAQPALPPTPAVPQQMAAINPSDAALGFKPSSAPPLDPSISQFVAAPIIDHYRQTAANAGVMMNSGTPVRMARSKPAMKLRRPGAAVGGPEHMTGAVVANLDALQTSAPAVPPSAYANARGLPATAVVFFPNDTVSLSADGKAQVRAAVEQYRAGGGQGYIRVVGHSSSRTANMPVEKHIEIIFRKSQERANAVAQEIIREGVPADKVLVEAVGDTQPVYYESMPKGEDGNRRAEIFLQG